MEQIISFWQHPEGNKVRVLYLSPVSWDNTLMADIDLNNESIAQVTGHEENRHQIAKFNLEMQSDANGYRKLGQTRNDLAILHEAWNVIEKSCNEYDPLRIHVTAVLQYHYIYTDASHLPLGEIRKQMNEVYISLCNGQGKDAFFCGTTADLDIQMEWHRLHDYEPTDNLVYAWICPHVRIGEILEQWAQEEGYNTTVNRNMDYEKKRNAVIVYLFKKSKLERNNETIQTIIPNQN